MHQIGTVSKDDAVKHQTRGNLWQEQMPTAFLPLQNNTKSTPTAFSFIKNKTRSAEFPASSTISHKLCKNIALKTPNNLCCFRCHYSELAYTLVLFLERMLLIIRQKEPAMWLASLK